jgi:hypothetical protein
MALKLAQTTAEVLAGVGLTTPRLNGNGSKNGSKTAKLSPTEEAAARIAALLAAGRLDPALITAIAETVARLTPLPNVDVVVTEEFAADYASGKVAKAASSDAVHKVPSRSAHALAAAHVQRRVGRGPVKWDDLVAEVAAIRGRQKASRTLEELRSRKKAVRDSVQEKAARGALKLLEDLRAKEAALDNLSNFGDIGACEKEIKRLRTELTEAIALYRATAEAWLASWVRQRHILVRDGLVYRRWPVSLVRPPKAVEAGGVTTVSSFAEAAEAAEAMAA